MTSDNEELLRKAFEGDIEDHEVALVARRLDAARPDEDRYGLLHILGHAGDRCYRPLVERFLECSDDPMLAHLALQTLCLFWGETERYMGHVLRFLRGVEWDREELVRQLAASMAGEYLRASHDEVLLRELVRIWDDQSEDPLTRENAYFGLCRAMGREWEEMPSAAKFMDIPNDADPRVIEGARDRLRRGG